MVQGANLGKSSLVNITAQMSDFALHFVQLVSSALKLVHPCEAVAKHRVCEIMSMAEREVVRRTAPWESGRKKRLLEVPSRAYAMLT